MAHHQAHKCQNKYNNETVQKYICGGSAALAL